MLLEGHGESLERARRSLTRLLESEDTAALATNGQGAPLLCTVFFAYREGNLWFTSQESTRHIIALRNEPTVSFAVWRRPHEWGRSLFGAQLTCTASEVSTREDAAEGLHTLHRRFPTSQSVLARLEDVYGAERKTCLVRLTIRAGTLIDEDEFGRRNFLGFTWQR